MQTTLEAEDFRANKERLLGPFFDHQKASGRHFSFRANRALPTPRIRASSSFVHSEFYMQNFAIYEFGAFVHVYTASSNQT